MDRDLISLLGVGLVVLLMAATGCTNNAAVAHPSRQPGFSRAEIVFTQNGKPAYLNKRAEK